MPDLGIAEAIAAFGGADILGGLFGGGAAAAEGAGIGAGLAGGGTALADAGALLGAGAAGAGGAAAGVDALAGGSSLPAPTVGADGIGVGLSGGGTALEAGGADLAGIALPETAGLTAGALPSSVPASSITAPGVTPAAGVQSVGGAPGIPSSVANEFGATGLPGVTSSAAPAAAPAVAPAGTAGGLDLSSLGSFAKNYGPLLGAGVGAAGLGYSILNANKTSPQTQALQNETTSLQSQVPALNAASQGLAQQGQALQAQGTSIANQGQSYTNYLESGTLPPALQTQVDQAVAGAKAKIISNFAAQGMNTDPNKNSVLRDELAAADQQGKIMQGQLAQQLLTSGTGLIGAGGGLESTGASLQATSVSDLINTGAQYGGLSTQLLTQLSNIDQTNTANIGKAIASFAASLGGNRNVNLNLGGNQPATVTP